MSLRMDPAEPLVRSCPDCLSLSAFVEPLFLFPLFPPVRMSRSPEPLLGSPSTFPVLSTPNPTYIPSYESRSPVSVDKDLMSMNLAMVWAMDLSFEESNTTSIDFDVFCT